jgi:hypothetical protein
LKADNTKSEYNPPFLFLRNTPIYRSLLPQASPLYSAFYLLPDTPLPNQHSPIAIMPMTWTDQADAKVSQPASTFPAYIIRKT